MRRELVPAVILSALVHRGADFASAEDAVQDALVRSGARLAERDAAAPIPKGVVGHRRLAKIP